MIHENDVQLPRKCLNDNESWDNRSLICFYLNIINYLFESLIQINSTLITKIDSIVIRIYEYAKRFQLYNFFRAILAGWKRGSPGVNSTRYETPSVSKG